MGRAKPACPRSALTVPLGTRYGCAPFQKSSISLIRSITMTQEYKPGEIVPQSGIYTITHDPMLAGTPHEVTVIKGRRVPTCRHCKGITFELAHAARHVGEIDKDAHEPAG